jgi:hypothetical protein
MTNQEQQEYFTRMESEVVKPRFRHVILVATDDNTVWTADQRAHHMAWHRKHREVLRQICIGTAFVMPEASVVVRFALSAMMMLTTGSPSQIFRDEESARRWTSKLLSARSIAQSSS